jgi:hypothetical protein
MDHSAAEFRDSKVFRITARSAAGMYLSLRDMNLERISPPPSLEYRRTVEVNVLRYELVETKCK